MVMLSFISGSTSFLFQAPRKVPSRLLHSSKVIEFEMPPPSESDKDAILYAFGVNLAKQLPPDLKSLLSNDELEISLKGMTDVLLDRMAVDPQALLKVWAPQLHTSTPR